MVVLIHLTYESICESKSESKRSEDIKKKSSVGKCMAMVVLQIKPKCQGSAIDTQNLFN